MQSTEVTIADVLEQSVRSGDYATWDECALLSEIAHRHLTHGVSSISFPDDERRRLRLIEILGGNDKYRNYLRTLVP